jgi:hypothetical protein
LILSKAASRLLILVFLAMAAGLVVQAFVGTSSAHAATVENETPARTWNTNGTVWDTQLSEDGKTLYIGGKFTRVRENPPGVAGASVAVSNVAAIDVATGTAVRTWTPQVTGTGAFVRSLAVKGDRVFIGGTFTAVGGQPRQNLAAVDAVDGEPTDGSVDPFAPQVVKAGGTPDVSALLTGDSKLYSGGLFSSVDGRSRANLAAFDLATGALDPSWTPKTSGSSGTGPPKVRDLKFASDKATIFVAGRFTNVTGSNSTTPERRESVARLETGTGNLNPWKIPDGVISAPQDGWDLAVTPTRLYGGFGAGPNFAAAFRLDNGNTGSQVWRFGTVGNVQTVELTSDGTRLFLGGHFGTNRLEQTVCGNRPLSGLVSVNPATGATYCDWVPQLAPSIDNGNGAHDFTILPDGTGEALWVGGGFTQVTGGDGTTVTQPNIARFDPRDFAVPQVDLNGLSSGGLDATYLDNINFTGTQLSRTDSTVNFDWGSGSPHPSIGPDTFSALWTGQVEAPVSGNYTFTTTSDDGVRLFVDGKLIIDNWTDHGPTDNSGTIALEAGRRYDVQMDFYENGGGAVAKLQWSFPLQLRQTIPSNRLFFPGGIDYSATFTSGTGPTLIVDPDKLSVMDADDTDLKSAKVTLTNRPDGTAERLSADTAGSAIASSFDAQTGVLTLQGPATKEAFRQVLGTVRHDNTSASPTAGERKVTFVVNDGTRDSKAATSTVLSVDATPPTISTVAPDDGATDAAVDANVEATFSEAMDETSVENPGNFTLTKDSDGSSVAASVSYDPSTNKATLNPDAPLDPQSTYTATIKGGTDGVKDSSGNPLANDEIWSFTTTLPCTIPGTSNAETIMGTSGDDVICAGAGNDTIQALEGNDTIRGEGGADQLHGGIGDDRLEGGLGTDTANFTASVASVTASLEAGTATGEGSDTFSEVENVIGSNLADMLTGSGANNTLNGGGGNDSIDGLGGADTLKGVGGNDSLDSQDGVEGNDAVDGGTGTDTCTMDATELSILSCEL